MRVYNYDNEPFDFCRKCAPDWAEHMKQAILELNSRISIPWQKLEFGNEEDYEVDCEHPNYGDTDYDCEACGQKLTDKD
tara:strand:- start:129 stop:365 length:237 start_codon:yes stop_codon:yes gene_type:complete